MRTIKLKDKRAFTLVETIVAVGILFVGLIGILILLAQSFKSVRLAQDRMLAAQLAQEGIEVVVAIRDSNWVSSQNWRTNLPSGQGIVNYNSTSVALVGNPANWCLSLVGGRYEHAAPPCNTRFSRHVEIIDATDTISGTPVPYIEVRSIVDWVDSGNTRSISIVDHLYDWQ